MGYFERMSDIAMMPSFAITQVFQDLYYFFSKFLIRAKVPIFILQKRKNLVIFVNLISVEKYLSEINLLRRQFVLTFVVDTYDEILHRRPKWIEPDERWFAPHIQNVLLSTGILIPVGVEPRKWNLNGKERNLKYSPPPLNGKVLMGPLKITHPSRIELLNLPNTETISVLKDRIPPKKYAKLTENFDFVCCPRGNGLDTHRLWEVLYRGRIPIMIQSEHTEFFKSHGLPILLVNTFTSLYELSQEMLSKIASEMAFEPNDVPALMPQYWWKLISSENQIRGRL